MFQNTELADIDYKLCLSSGRPEEQCFYSLGGINLGYGICIAGVGKADMCDQALGSLNTDFGLCMAAGRSVYKNADGTYNYEDNYYQCRKALGGDNTGFGLCMLNPDKSLDNCNNGIGKTNIGFGLCMSEHRNEIERCRDLRVQTADAMESDFFLSQNGGAKQSISNAVVSSSTPLKIELSLTPDYQYLHQEADVFVVAEIKDANGHSTFYQKNGDAFNPWDISFASLSPAYSNVELKGTMKSVIFEGALNNIKGTINLYHGYRLKSAPVNEVKYNDNRQISFTVN